MLNLKLLSKRLDLIFKGKTIQVAGRKDMNFNKMTKKQLEEHAQTIGIELGRIEACIK